MDRASMLGRNREGGRGRRYSASFRPSVQFPPVQARGGSTSLIGIGAAQHVQEFRSYMGNTEEPADAPNSLVDRTCISAIIDTRGWQLDDLRFPLNIEHCLHYCVDRGLRSNKKLHRDNLKVFDLLNDVIDDLNENGNVERTIETTHYSEDSSEDMCQAQFKHFVFGVFISQGMGHLARYEHLMDIDELFRGNVLCMKDIMRTLLHLHTSNSPPAHCSHQHQLEEEMPRSGNRTALMETDNHRNGNLEARSNRPDSTRNGEGRGRRRRGREEGRQSRSRSRNANDERHRRSRAGFQPRRRSRNRNAREVIVIDADERSRSDDGIYGSASSEGGTQEGRYNHDVEDNPSGHRSRPLNNGIPVEVARRESSNGRMASRSLGYGYWGEAHREAEDRRRSFTEASTPNDYTLDRSQANAGRGSYNEAILPNNYNDGRRSLNDSSPPTEYALDDSQAMRERHSLDHYTAGRHTINRVGNLHAISSVCDLSSSSYEDEMVSEDGPGRELRNPLWKGNRDSYPHCRSRDDNTENVDGKKNSQGYPILKNCSDAFLMRVIFKAAGIERMKTAEGLSCLSKARILHLHRFLVAGGARINRHVQNRMTSLSEEWPGVYAYHGEKDADLFPTDSRTDVTRLRVCLALALGLPSKFESFNEMIQFFRENRSRPLNSYTGFSWKKKCKKEKNNTERVSFYMPR